MEQRNSRIALEEKTHKYIIDGRDQEYTSVTSTIYSLFKKFDQDEVIDKMMKSDNWSNSKYFGMSKSRIKQEWRKTGREAAKLGTELHKDIENYYSDLPYDGSSKEFLFFSNFVFDHMDFIPYKSEFAIFDEESKIAGTVDMLYKYSDQYVLVDWKRSKEIKTENVFQKGIHELSAHIDNCNFNHYSLQLSLYKYILEKCYNISISECFIVVLHPDNENYKKIPITNYDTVISKLLKGKYGE